MMTEKLSEQERLEGLENDKIGTALVYSQGAMQVWHLRLAPGETLPPHRHDRSYFWTVLTDGKGRSRYDDGRIVEVTYVAGDTRYFPRLTPENPVVHDLTNIGSSDLLFVTVEFEHS